MAGLAAGSAAGVQHALVRRQLEQVGGQLRGLILHADPAFGKAWQFADVTGLHEVDAVTTELAGGRFEADAVQLFQVGIAAVVAAVHPQGHRRVGVVRGADGLVLLRP